METIHATLLVLLSIILKYHSYTYWGSAHAAHSNGDHPRTSILVLRTAMSALSILSVVIKGNIGGIVLYSLIALLTFWFTATCLTIICDAEGDKRIEGVVVVG